MNRKANIRSVTYIPAGTRIIIFPNEDLWLNDEKRDKEKEVTGGYGQGNSGLTDKEPETMGTRGGATVTYDGTYNENVRPAGGGLVEETPAQNPNRRIRQLPPATIQQMPAEETTDDVPALLQEINMSDFSVLESVLRPLSYWYTQDNLEEVAINRAGQIWLRMRGKRAYPWVMYKDEKLSKEYFS